MRIARLPFGNAAQATSTVRAGISGQGLGCMDTRAIVPTRRRTIHYRPACCAPCWMPPTPLHNVDPTLR